MSTMRLREVTGIVAALAVLLQLASADDANFPAFEEPPSFELSTSAPLTGIARFTTDRPCTTTVTVATGEFRTAVPVSSTPALEHRIPVLGLRPAREYLLNVQIEAKGQSAAAEPVSFRTAPLPDDFPTIRVTQSRPEQMEPGVTLFSLFRWENDAADNSFGVFVGVDHSGEIIWYYRIGSPAAALHVLPGGDLQFIHGVPPRFIRRINLLGETVREYEAAALGGAVRDGTIAVDVDTFHHDFAHLPDESLLALTTEARHFDRFPLNVARPRRGFGPAHVVGDVVAHINFDGSIRQRWALLDILDPLRMTWSSHDSFWDQRAYNHIDGGTKDWSHANAVIRDPQDGRLVVSLRHQDAVVKFDPMTSEVVWILGTRAGWRGELARRVLKPTSRLEWQYHQHGIKFTPHGTLLMFDNGNLRAIPPTRPMPPTEAYSRAVEYEIDDEAMTVTQVWSYGGSGSRDQFYSPFLCDADWLPQTGNVLITDGAHATDENNQPVNDPPGAQQWARLVEVTHEEQPEILWELLVDDRRSRPALGWSVYRAERIPSLYAPVAIR